MGRLIDVQNPDEVRAPLVVEVGDLVMFNASGARLLDELGVLELIGPFSPAVLGTSGEVLAAAGGPNTVLVRAARAGTAALDVMTGEPWHEPRATRIEMQVT